jgi:hypothetical protein
VDALVLLVGSALSGLRSIFGADICPGGWAWTVSAFGVLVGLLPTAGAVAVAALRRRAGAGYPRGGMTVPAIGVATAGLLPWLAFAATGSVFRNARLGGVGLTAADRASLAEASCLGMSQRAYLGSVSVSGALGHGPLRAALFTVPLVGFPIVAGFFVWLQARAALRRGPHWPCRFFWLSFLVMALLTGPLPAGATAQLWFGVLIGTSGGLFVVLLIPPPARAPVRSLWPARSAKTPSARPKLASARPKEAPRPLPRPTSARVRPNAAQSSAARASAKASSPAQPRADQLADQAAKAAEAAKAWARNALAGAGLPPAANGGWRSWLSGTPAGLPPAANGGGWRSWLSGTPAGSPPAANGRWRDWLAGTPLARPPAPPAGNPPGGAAAAPAGGSSSRAAGSSSRVGGSSSRAAGSSSGAGGSSSRAAGSSSAAGGSSSRAAGSSSRAGGSSSRAAGSPLAADPGPLPTPASGAVVPKPRPPATLVESPNGVARRFDLLHQLGSGGFGGVWLAMDHRLGHRVAIKAAHVPDHDTELRIHREARALGAVAHPNCVRILDLVDSQTDPGLAGLRGLVIVMEYVDGQSLGELVTAHGPVDDLAAARIWLRTAGALAAAHQRGVLHRDVKPSNVVLDHQGEPHLIDFGIARARGDMTLTMHGMVIGTPDFLAPEIARGDRATPSSDAWQLAATISFALTGAPPRGDHPGAATGLRAAAFSTAPTHLPGHSVHRPLLAACLASEPTARPDLAEVRRALEPWLAGHQPAGAGRGANLVRGGQRARR